MPPRTSTDQNQSGLSLNLTQEEVFRLLEDKTPETLISISDKIAGAYNHKTLNNNESMAAEQIFRLLLRETELRVRISLAQHVKTSTTLPHDIALSLARDVEEVALPMLQFSQVLSDKDLIDLIDNTHDISRFVAVSRRERVASNVTETLLARGNDEVAAALINNTGADISETGLKKIVDYYPENKELMTALSHRPQLPIAVAEKLINVVSHTLAETLKQKYTMPAKEIEQEVEKTRENETLNLVRVSLSQEEIDKLVAQLIAFNRLSPSIILTALCQGNFTFFETSLARLSNIAVSNARALINDRGELGFRAIYNKSGLPETMFPAVKLLLKAVRELDAEGEKPGSPHYANRIVERILTLAENNPTENVSYIIALVRRNTQ